MRRVAFILLLALAPTPVIHAEDRPAPLSKVVRVVDGDTVVVELDGRPVTVRLIGVDSPESVHPSKPAERFGVEASKVLKGQLAGRSVRLVFEPGTARLDRFGRTLAYLVRDDGLAVNREIIAQGYGHAYVKYPSGRMEDFRGAEAKAREGKLGLWGPDPPKAAEGAKVATVYVTRTGEKYHAEGCRYLAKGATAMTLGEAAKGRTPFSRFRIGIDLSGDATKNRVDPRPPIGG